MFDHTGASRRTREQGAHATAEVIDQFRSALELRDILPPAQIIADGRLHRCDAVGKNGKGDAAYLLHLNGIPAGGFENWRDGLGWQSWRLDIGRPLAPPEAERLVRQAEQAKAQHEIETSRRHAEAQARAVRIWQAACPAQDTHPYLVRKGVRAHGLQLYKGALVIPLRDAAGELRSLQFIGASGAKRFLKGSRVAGLYCVIGAPGKTLCIVEGYATGASLHAATGHAVAIAFHAGNLSAVAQSLRACYPDADLILCVDDDVGTPGNPGLTHARHAAPAVGARLAIPDFGAERPEDATDFNDMARIRGADAVAEAIAAASAVAGDTPKSVPDFNPVASESEWPEPDPLTEQFPARPYPVEVLPPLIRDAVTEAQAFVQAPIALVACSALSTLSLAAQGLVNVRRDHQLVGPVSLYVLAVADSGERKTTCDSIFCPALREWESERIREMSSEILEFEAMSAVHQAKRAGILEAIKHQRRKGQDTADREGELQELVSNAPAVLSIPRLIYVDATPEALAHALATGWPSGGVLSAEAGAVFGAHGMGQDTVLRNLALLNVLWDGGEMAIDRRSRPSFLLRGRRLTFGLMAQPEALRSFLERTGSLPRGTGFIARFLVAWPQSTQGKRLYRPAPAAMPKVERFGDRIRELLGRPLATDEQGCLTPVVLDLSPGARAEWIRFHDGIERELGAQGEFRTVRDVGAKAAENVARLAALFHVLAHGVSGAIGGDDITAAGRVVDWHLNEARRLLADMDTPPSLAAAIRFDAWLQSEALLHASNLIPTRRIYQFGPNCVRESRDFRAALAVLVERGRARMEQDGRRRYVAVNPALLDRPA